MRRQPVLVLGGLRVRHLGEDFAQRIARDVGFLDAHDGGFTDFEHRHSPSSACNLRCCFACDPDSLWRLHKRQARGARTCQGELARAHRATRTGRRLQVNE